MKELNERFSVLRDLVAFVGMWRLNNDASDEFKGAHINNNTTVTRLEIDIKNTARGIVMGEMSAKHAWRDLQQQM